MIITALIGSVSGGDNGIPVPDIAIQIPYPTNNYSVISPGSNKKNNVAWYKFELLTGPTDINVNTVGSNGGNSLDTEIGVYDINGDLIGSDDDNGGNGWSNLTLLGLNAGTYYVAVGLYQINFNGSFNAFGENAGSGISNIIFTVQAAV